MNLPIQLLSTDFDGTLHAEFEDPPIPRGLEELIRGLQAAGMVWVINTGRDLSSLMETLGRAKVGIWPDYVVTVEREIYLREDSRYVGVEDWNRGCELAHAELFRRVRPDLPRLMEWIQARFRATLYEDIYSPFCLIAESVLDAEKIHRFMDEYCATVPHLTVVRNDIYARFSHAAYSKGTALGEITRRLRLSPERVAAAGDHLNDLPMLTREYARWLIAPSNAVELVKEAVRRQDGYLSEEPHGYGVWRGIEAVLEASRRGSGRA